MTTETILLVLLCSTLILTTMGGKAMFAAWVWLIFFTFPGTYSTQPAVTTQTFGHKHGGTIYGFLFTSDIVNNFLISWLAKPIKETWGWQGLFFSMAGSAFCGTIATCFFPWKPTPDKIKVALIGNGGQSGSLNNAEEAAELTKMKVDVKNEEQNQNAANA